MLKRSGLVAYLLLCLNTSSEATKSIDDLDNSKRQQVLDQGFPLEATFCPDCFTCPSTLLVYEGIQYVVNSHECGEVDLTVFEKMFEQAEEQPTAPVSFSQATYTQKLGSPSPLRHLLLTAMKHQDDSPECTEVYTEILSNKTKSLSPAQARSQILRPTFSGNDLYLLAEVLQEVTNALLSRPKTPPVRAALKRSVGSNLPSGNQFDYSMIKAVSPPH